MVGLFHGLKISYFKALASFDLMMNKDKRNPAVSSDPLSLTSFGEPKEESISSTAGFFKFVLDFFSNKKDDNEVVEGVHSGDQIALSRPNVLNLNQSGKSKRKSLPRQNSGPQPGSEVEVRLRSFSTFLREFPRLVRGQQSPDSDDNQPLPTSPTLSAAELRQYWMPDEQCHECYECGEKFTTFRRRHHCRICGQIFCSRCCNQLISGKIMGLQGMLRSCMYCCRLVLRFAEGNKPDVAKAISQSLNGSTLDSTFDEQLNESNSIESLSGVQNQNKAYDQIFGSHRVRQQSQSSTLQRVDSTYGEDQLFDAGPSSALSVLSPVSEQRSMQTPGFIFDTTRLQSSPTSILGSDVKNDLVKDSLQLHMIWRKVCDEKEGIEFRDHRFRLRKYSNCITGQEFIDWLLKNDLASNRTQGRAIGQALCEGQWMKSVLDEEGIFEDGYILYQGHQNEIHPAQNRIEIYPDHFAASDDHDGSTLHDLTQCEPVWVQEIKFNGGNDEVDGDFGGYSDDLTWSDAQSSVPNDILLYSDEEQSISEQSAVSLSSYVEINQGDEVITYKRSSSSGNMDLNKTLVKCSSPIHPMFEDYSFTSISAEYLRSFITWNGTVLNNPWHRPSSGWREVDLTSKSVETCDKRAFHWLREMYLRHNLAFLRQLLCNKGLDLVWADILIPLARHASFHISPDPNVNMDICHYVQIKKVPGAHRRDSSIINGVVFTKNVVNKNMRTDILNPSILLLAIPLEYERVQLKLSALDPVVRQEREFYKHLITRVTSKHPNVILAQCTVSRIAQELLFEAGITVIVNVKRSVMERIARSTEADIVYSIDQLMQANLGRCSRFYLKRHVFHEGRSLNDETSKTFLYFDGCDPLYGCTVLLRETRLDSKHEVDVMSDLVKIKDVFRFLVRAMFHVRLELSYLIDQHSFGKLLRKRHGSTRSVHSDSEPISNSFEDTVIENNALLVSDNEGLVSSNSNESSMLHETRTSQSNFTMSQELTNLEQIDSHRTIFDNALKSVLLSTSPVTQPKMPYLLTDKGQKSTAWKFLPAKILHFNDTNTRNMQVLSHKADAIAKVVSPMQEIPWISNLQPAEPCNHLNDNVQSVSTEDKQNERHYSKEISAENAHPNTSSTKASLDAQRSMSYSKQHRQTKFDISTDISDALSTMKQPDANHGLRSWEQTMIDMIFGPPTNTFVEKKSEFQTNDHENEAQSNSRSLKKRKGKNPSNRNIYSEMTDESLHEFISFSFTQSASSEEVKDLLSNFRSHAGSLFHRVDCDDHDDMDEVDNFQTPAKRPSTLFKPVLNPDIDSLDPGNHQRIAVLFSSYSLQSPISPLFCVPPWVVNIDFYRGNDITLGGFLERYCFRPVYHCPNAACRRPMVEHVRSFVYGNMCMSVLLKELSKPFQQSTILTWTWDHATRKSSSIKAMSHDAWFMSFAKFLELHLSSLSIPDMGSLPYQKQGILKQEVFDEDWELKPFNGFQYFLFRDLVAAFKCFPIQLHEIVFPVTFLSQPSGSDRFLLSGKICNGCSDDIVTSNDAYYVCKTLWEKIERASEDIENCIHSSQDRRVMNDTSSEEIPLSREKYFLELLSSLNNETSTLKEHVNEMEYFLKTNGYVPLENIAPFPDLLECIGDDEMDDPPLPDNLRNHLCLHVLQLKCDISQMVHTWNQKLADAYDKDKTSFWNPPKSRLSSSPRTQRKKTHEVIHEEKELPENEDVDVAFQGSTSCPSTVLLANALQDESSEIDGSEDLLSHKSARKLKRVVSTDSKVHENPVRRLTRTGSNMKFLVARLLPGNVLSPSCPMPFPSDEHYLLSECHTTGIVVRDTEPTSIIAYTLCSNEYKKAVKHGNASSETLTIDDTQKEEIMPSDENSVGNITKSSENPALIDGSSFENPMMKDNGTQQTSIANSVTSDHIEVQFADATTRFYCKVYFAQLFQKFRSQVLEGGENQYLTSISRSVKWLARGGKSGLAFHKTQDDQFILKQMSYFEMQSFLEFAPKYVSYITSCIENNKATAISKILGVYRISFRNSETGRSLKHDVLVIENLFYGKKVNRIFDLKGSVRNRHVKPTSKESTESTSKKEDVVLLDENLLKIMCENPIYIHEHTKFLLKNAMQRDTDFLAKNLIMDYSLLIGIDADNQIFIGIIDFIRTFTWDKKLEMVVKWSSSRSMPTVVSPELYKNRFCEAMDRYFLVVPDRWYGMHQFEENPIQET